MSEGLGFLMQSMHIFKGAPHRCHASDTLAAAEDEIFASIDATRRLLYLFLLRSHQNCLTVTYNGTNERIRTQREG